MKIGLAVLVLLASRLAVAGEPISPLSRPISQFSIGKTSVLNALLWLGHDEGICFGIEFSGSDLTREVQIQANQSTVGEVVRKILGSAERFPISVANGVVLIQKKGLKPPTWLDHRLPEFELPRIELMEANNALWMAVERDLYPSLRGFAGDFPATADRVGPFRERRQTVRQILVTIAAGSRGAGWFPSRDGIRTSFPASINRFWTLVTYIGQTGARPR